MEKLKFQKLVTSVLLVASTTGVLMTAPKRVQAVADTNTTESGKPVENIVNKPNLTKQGYVLTIQAPSGKIYVGQKNYKKQLTTTKPISNAKSVSWKKIKNVRFRIEKVAYATKVIKFGGAPQYLLVSKDKKYSCWTTRYSIKYYFWNTKKMQQVIKPLSKLTTRNSSSLKKIRNKQDFNQAVLAAKRLPANQRKVVLESLNQVKKVGNIDKAEDNILLFSF